MIVKKKRENEFEVSVLSLELRGVKYEGIECIVFN